MANVHSVLKFGGSSVGSKEGIDHAVDRIEESLKEGPSAVVVSAARPPEVEGTTNRLVQLFRSALSGNHDSGALQRLMDMHASLMKDLELPEDGLNARSEELHSALGSVQPQQALDRLLPENKKALDRIQTWGEQTMYRTIFHPYLESRGIPSIAVDAGRLIRTDNTFGDARVDERQTYTAIQRVLTEHLRQGRVPVIPGFYGNDKDGNTVAFSRGGSDYTAALIAGGLQPNQLDICTDVDGVLQVDPRRISNNQYVNRFSYWEMLVYANRGASVVHRNAIAPLMKNGESSIPMRIVNTNTGVSNTTVSDASEYGMKAIGALTGQTFISIRGTNISDPGVLQDVATLFAQEGLAIDVLSSEIPTIEMTVDGEVPDRVIERLQHEFHSCNVHTNANTIVLVGNEIRRERAIFDTVLNATQQSHLAITDGPDSITTVVPEDVADDAIQQMYDVLLAKT